MPTPSKKSPRPSRKKRELSAWQRAWVSWVNASEWTWFATFTTPYELTLKSARRLVERTFTAWERIDPALRMFWVAERYEVKDGWHIHALVYMPKGPENFLMCVEAYQRMAGGRIVGNKSGKNQWWFQHSEKPITEKQDKLTKRWSVVRSDAGSRWCRVELKKFDPKRCAGEYLIPYLVIEQGSMGADYDLLVSRKSGKLQAPGS